MATRQIQFETTGGPDVLKLVEVDLSAPGLGEVRIANRAIGLNFIDIYFRTALYPAELHSLMGTEGAGVIEAVGDDVHDFTVSDRVAYVGGAKGAYADDTLQPASAVYVRPDAIDFDTAAA